MRPAGLHLGALQFPKGGAKGKSSGKSSTKGSAKGGKGGKDGKKSSGGGKPSGEGGKAGADRSRELCAKYLRGHCQRGEKCYYVHDDKALAAVVAGVKKTTGAQASQQQAPTGGVSAGASSGPQQAPPGVNAVQLQLADKGTPNSFQAWVRPSPQPGCGAIFDPGQDGAIVAAVAPQGSLACLDELPREVWKETIPLPLGYSYRSTCETPGMVHGLLFDGGSVLSLVMEEVLVCILNAAAERGLTTDSNDWPLAGLERWPETYGDVLAGTV